jgi:hypothetical protein
MPGSSGAIRSSLVKIREERLSSASSYSLVIVSERVGQASMHRPQKMQRR